MCVFSVFRDVSYTLVSLTPLLVYQFSIFVFIDVLYDHRVCINTPLVCYFFYSRKIDYEMFVSKRRYLKVFFKSEKPFQDDLTIDTNIKVFIFRDCFYTLIVSLFIHLRIYHRYKTWIELFVCM